MKYYVQLFSKWYAFACIFISCQKIFVVDKKGLRRRQLSLITKNSFAIQFGGFIEIETSC